MKRLLLILLALSSSAAFAQTATLRLAWDRPAAYANATPLPAAVALTYEVQKQSGTSWTALTTTTALTYDNAGLSAGEHCYRIRAIATGSVPPESAWSPTLCRTIAPPPGPPVWRSIEPTAYRINQARDDLRLIAFGTVPLGTPCDPDDTANGMLRVDRATATLAAGVTTRPNVVLARCGTS